MVQKKQLYTLISLDDFKAVLGIDDREDKISRFCIRISTMAIENYCMRYFSQRIFYKCFNLSYTNYFELTEYPVLKIVSLAVENYPSLIKEKLDLKNCFCVPDIREKKDIPHILCFNKPLPNYPYSTLLSVRYRAGYNFEEIPADLSAACMELAVWNYARYKGRRIGLTYDTRNNQNKEIFELIMPENVKALIEPYRRKVI